MLQEKMSILGNIIQYDDDSLQRDIGEILRERFSQDIDLLGKSLDDLYDPYLLADMDKAVARIKLAKYNHERVIIFGDYDVDGVTSTSILMHFFKKINMQVSYRLPHRVHDGYGLKSYFIDEAKTLGVTLIITVDCGTRDIEIVEYAKSLGIDIIITDHHAVPERIPEAAVALINPKRLDCQYPFKHLAGAGVAYKLMMALAREFLKEDEYKLYLRESIDIAAIGTVADCMKLTGENRIIVQEGLKQLKYSRSKGIRRIIEEKIHEDLDADIFGFLIGPRLNAAGRMDTPYKAVSLLLNQDDSVLETVLDIESLNDKRRKLTHKFVDEALLNINTEDNLIFYHSPEIEHGIIGIVAGRLTEKYYKPSIVLIENADEMVASCRSPEFFSIVDLLEKKKHFFSRFGGHKQAAGFTIKKSDFEVFKSEVLAEINLLDFSQYKKHIIVDKVVNEKDICFKFLEKVSEYKPFGLGNPKPLFLLSDFPAHQVEYLGKGVDHIKIPSKHGFKICGFNFGLYKDTIKDAQKISLIVDINEDNFNGKKNIMLKIVDIIIE